MKNILSVTIVFLTILASTTGFARGLSLGVLGSYAVDSGAIEKSSSLTVIQYVDKEGKSDYKSSQVIGTVFFIRYDFKNNLFLRSGFEHNILADGGELNYNYFDGDPNGKTVKDYYKKDYQAFTVPLYLGITLSPDRGKTNIYAGTGAAFSIIDINLNAEIYEFHSGQIQNEFYGHFKQNHFHISHTSIIGLERNIFSNFFLVIEFAFYARDSVKTENVDMEISYWEGNPGYGAIEQMEYTEHYGLPRIQLRAGLKYNF